jgi:hypothetical protein
LNIRYDRVMIHYRDFSNELFTAAFAAGDAPQYRLNANVLQVFVSIWY